MKIKNGGLEQYGNV